MRVTIRAELLAIECRSILLSTNGMAGVIVCEVMAEEFEVLRQFRLTVSAVALGAVLMVTGWRRRPNSRAQSLMLTLLVVVAKLMTFVGLVIFVVFVELVALAILLQTMLC
jgi:hypothetical protein